MTGHTVLGVLQRESQLGNHPSRFLTHGGKVASGGDSRLFARMRTKVRRSGLILTLEI